MEIDESTDKCSYCLTKWPLFIKQTCIKHLRHTRHCFRCWCHVVNKTEGLCPHGTFVLVVGTDNQQRQRAMEDVRTKQPGRGRMGTVLRRLSRKSLSEEKMYERMSEEIWREP